LPGYEDTTLWFPFNGVNTVVSDKLQMDSIMKKYDLISIDRDLRAIERLREHMFLLCFFAPMIAFCCIGIGLAFIFFGAFFGSIILIIALSAPTIYLMKK
jgi:hypothetical protein